MTSEPITPTTFDFSLEDVERPKINIEGVGMFEVADYDDYSISVLRAMNRMWNEIQKWAEADKLTDKQSKDYEAHIEALLSYACPTLPKEVREHHNFKRSMKEAIIVTFFLSGWEKHPMMQRMRNLQAPIVSA